MSKTVSSNIITLKSIIYNTTLNMFKKKFFDDDKTFYLYHRYLGQIKTLLFYMQKFFKVLVFQGLQVFWQPSIKFTRNFKKIDYKK